MKLVVLTLLCLCLETAFASSNTHANSPGAAPAAKTGHTVIVDAGSTKTQMLVYRTQSSRDNQYGLTLKRVTKCTRGVPLGALNAAARAGRLIKDLFDECKIAEIVHGSASSQEGGGGGGGGWKFGLYGTAGLRLKQKQHQTLVRDILVTVEARVIQQQNSVFRRDAMDLRVIPAGLEAGFAFISTNFQLGNYAVGKAAHELVGTVEMGGGSLQYAYVKRGKLQMRGWDTLGQMSFRRAFYGRRENASAPATSVCLHEAFAGNFSFNGEQFAERGRPFAGDRQKHCYEQAYAQVARDIRQPIDQPDNGFFKFLGSAGYFTLKNAFDDLQLSYEEMTELTPSFRELRQINEYYCEYPVRDDKYKSYYCITTSQIRAVARQLGLYMDNRQVEFTRKYSWTVGAALEQNREEYRWLP